MKQTKTQIDYMGFKDSKIDKAVRNPAWMKEGAKLSPRRFK